MEPSTSNTTSPAVPIAIVVGFAMIALAIFFTGRGDNGSPQNVTDQTAVETQVAKGSIRPVDGTDYIEGNPNAPILLVEYLDYDCPFCKQFHDTLGQIYQEFGSYGDVAIVYRQFPLEKLHPNAPKISEAALCVGHIGGNRAFLDFSDLVFEQRDILEFTEIVRLPEYAERSGVDRAAYTDCMNEGRMKEAVAASIADGENANFTGTPNTVLIVGNQQTVINGAVEHARLRGVVQNLVDQLDGNFDPQAAAIEAETASESGIVE